MTQLRLLALTTSYPLRDRAAAGVFVRRLYRNMPGNWRITVLCPDDSTEASAQEISSVRPIPVRYAPKRWQVLSQNPGGIVAALRERRIRWLLAPLLVGAMLAKALRLARSSDLLHANWAICGAIAVVAGKVVGRPVVTTFRGDDIATADRSILMRLLLEIAVRGSRAIVCVSEAMGDDLKQRFPRYADRISVCLNGVGEAFLAVDRRPHSSGGLRLVAVGSLIRRKGYDTLLEAIARMKHRGEVTLRIAGEGPAREQLTALASALGLGKQITLLGEVPPEHVPELLADGDVFVLSSRSEGRPNVVLEALAAGLPVVSTMLPGVCDLVVEGETGWLVPVADAEAMSRALDCAFAKPALRELMSLKARDRLRGTAHGWAATGWRYDQIFHSCIQSPADAIG